MATESVFTIASSVDQNASPASNGSGAVSAAADVTRAGGKDVVGGRSVNVTHNITQQLLGGELTPGYAQTIIIIMYSTIIVLSVGGNAIVIFIVLAYQRMRTVTNYFIVNLACSDILMSVLCIPLSFVANLLMQYWPFGAVMCPVVTYAQAVSVFLSAFTLVAISLDRFRAIMWPLMPRMTTHQVFAVIALIWLLSGGVCLPIAIMSRVTRKPDPWGVPRDSCGENWPVPNQRYAYSLAIMVLQYFLPLFVLMSTYTCIAIVIWVKRTPGEAENNRDQRLAASKRKMVKMMITVVIVYALCWLPLHTITLVGDAHPAIWSYRYIQVVWISCHWLAMSNCCYNPIVYCWMNSKFRNGFRYVLRFCPCMHYSPGEHGEHRGGTGRVTTHASTLRGGGGGGGGGGGSLLQDRRVLNVYPTSPFASRMRQPPPPPSSSPMYSHESIPLTGQHTPFNGCLNGIKRYPNAQTNAVYTPDMSPLTGEGTVSD